MAISNRGVLIEKRMRNIQIQESAMSIDEEQIEINENVEVNENLEVKEQNKVTDIDFTSKQSAEVISEEEKRAKQRARRKRVRKEKEQKNMVGVQSHVDEIETPVEKRDSKKAASIEKNREQRRNARRIKRERELVQQEKKEQRVELKHSEMKEILEKETLKKSEEIQVSEVTVDYELNLEMQNRVSDDTSVRLTEVDKNELVEFWMALKNVVSVGITNPVEAMKAEEQSKYQTKYLIGLLYLLVIFITTTIHIPVVQGLMGVIGRMKLAILVVLFHMLILFCMSGLVYIFANRGNNKVSFDRIIGTYSIATSLEIILCMIAFLLGYISWICAFAVILVGLVYWVLLSTQITMYFTESNIIKSNFIIIIMTLFITIVLYFAIKMYILSIVTSVIEVSMSSVQASDGTITSSVQTLVQELVTFLRNLDTLLGNTN